MMKTCVAALLALLQQGADGGRVVERHDVRQPGQRSWDPGAARDTERHHSGSGLDQQ